MSKFAIDDLFVAEESLRDLKDRELKLSGGASTASSAGADNRDAVSASAATTDGNADAYASGGYRRYDYYGSYESGPSASAYASDRYYYPWWY